MSKSIQTLALLAAVSVFSSIATLTVLLSRDRAEENKRAQVDYTLQTGLRISAALDVCLRLGDGATSFTEISNLISSVVGCYECIKGHPRYQLRSSYDGSGGWILDISSQHVQLNTIESVPIAGEEISPQTLVFAKGYIRQHELAHVNHWLSREQLQQLPAEEKNAIAEAIKEKLQILAR